MCIYSDKKIEKKKIYIYTVYIHTPHNVCVFVCEYRYRSVGTLINQFNMSDCSC